MKWEHVNRHETKKKKFGHLGPPGISSFCRFWPKNFQNFFWPKKGDVVPWELPTGATLKRFLGRWGAQGGRKWMPPQVHLSCLLHIEQITEIQLPH